MPKRYLISHWAGIVPPHPQAFEDPDYRLGDEEPLRYFIDLDPEQIVGLSDSYDVMIIGESDRNYGHGIKIHTPRTVLLDKKGTRFRFTG